MLELLIEMCKHKSTCSGSLKISPSVKYTHIISNGSQATLLWIGSESSVCALLCHDWYFTSSLRHFSRDNVNNITHKTNMAHFLVSASGLNFLVFHNAAVVKGQCNWLDCAGNSTAMTRVAQNN